MYAHKPPFLDRQALYRREKNNLFVVGALVVVITLPFLFFAYYLYLSIVSPDRVLETNTVPIANHGHTFYVRRWEELLLDFLSFVGFGLNFVLMGMHRVLHGPARISSTGKPRRFPDDIVLAIFFASGVASIGVYVAYLGAPPFLRAS